jgi:uncharacterized protein
VSQENVDVVKRIYDAWREGHIGRRFMDPSIEYINPEEAIEPGTRQGPEGFQRVLEVWEGAHVEPDRFIEVGDEVVVIGTLRGRARASGIEIAVPHADIWTIRDGKAIRFRWFNDPREALEAVGLRE